MIKDLVNPTNFNLLVGKLGDVLTRALDLPLGYAINWGRIWSLWPVHLETACCSVEFGAASGPRYDVERFGIIEAFGSLRQCDLIVVQGTVTRKMAPRLRMVYDQMPIQNMLLLWAPVQLQEDCISILIMYCQVLMALSQLMYMYPDVHQDPKP